MTIVHNYHEKGSVPPYLDGSTCWTNASSTMLSSLPDQTELPPSFAPLVSLSLSRFKTLLTISSRALSVLGITASFPYNYFRTHCQVTPTRPLTVPYLSVRLTSHNRKVRGHMDLCALVCNFSSLAISTPQASVVATSKSRGRGDPT